MRSGKSQLHLVRYVVLALCACVLLFAASVKLSQYEDSSASHPNLVSQSKLWMNGQKLEVQELRTSQTLLPLLYLSLLVVAPIVLASRKRRMPVRVSNVRLQLIRFESHRFLRPPPSV